MVKYEVQLYRSTVDALVVEVEARDAEDARRKALKLNETQLDSEAWCDGAPSRRWVKRVWQVDPK